MQRLVYSPKAYVFIRRQNGQIADVSRYVVSGSVNRRLNAVSTASLTLRNHNMLFTAKGGRHAAFKPMDPITIYLQRLRNRPIRVFTGYLDETPYLELYPGTIEFQASCTLKRLLHTYFDPALPYTRDFLADYGWMPDASGGIKNPGAIVGNAHGKDGGMGELLYATLREIGGWKESNIKIEKLPPKLIERMSALFSSFKNDNKEARAEVSRLIENLVGAGDFGGSGGVSGDITLSGHNNVEKAFYYFRDMGFTDEQAAGAVGCMMQESGTNLSPTIVNQSTGDAYGIAQWTSTGNRKQRLTAKPNHGTLPVQLDHIRWELNNTHTIAKTNLHAANSIEEAVRNWLVYFEGVSTSSFEAVLATRYKYAHSVFKRYANKDRPRPQEESTGTNRDATTTERVPRRDGRDDKPDSGSSSSDQKIYAPIAGGTTGISGAWHEYRQYYNGGTGGYHSGIDVPCPTGTACVAPCDGKIGNFAQTTGFSGGGMVHFIFTEDVGEVKAGTVIGWGHVGECYVRPGEAVKGGQVIARSNHPAPHVHFVQRTDSNDMDGSVDPTPLFRALQKGETTPTSGGSGGGGGGDGGDADADAILSRANAAILAYNLNWATAEETLEAIALTGNKSLMNDKPLMPFIQQMSEASLRQFQSMPNGDFFAFYPDYFGETFGRGPYWYINDIEILEGRVKLSDEALVTHQYVVGDTNYSGDSFTNRVLSVGAVSIINAFVTEWVTQDPKKAGKDKDKNKGKTQEEVEIFRAFDRVLKEEEAVDFLQRYGARPNVEDDYPMIRHPFFELFLAYQHFMQAWARQFLTPFTFTFMPELYPAGKLGIPEHGLQMFIEEVTHNWDYTGGFITEAQLSAPAAMVDKNGRAINRDLPLNMPTALLEDF